MNKKAKTLFHAHIQMFTQAKTKSGISGKLLGQKKNTRRIQNEKKKNKMAFDSLHDSNSLSSAPSNTQGGNVEEFKSSFPFMHF